MHINKIHDNSSTTPVIFLTLTALSVMLWLSASLIGCSDTQPPLQISGTLLPEPKPLEAFQLTDHSGKPFTRKNTKGKWTFIFFGYTHCPDVCPTTLFQFKKIASLLDKTEGATQNTQFVLVSVDPERDTTEYLEKYIHYYHKDFIALTGKPEKIKALASQLGIFYMRTASKDIDTMRNDENNEDYLIDHSVSIMLLDPDSKLHALFGAPHSAAKITDDFLKIRNHFKNR